jgi:hypothetical protein
LVESGRALVSRDYRQADSPRSFQSVPELIAAIEDYLKCHKQSPRAFIWKASADSIMTKM